jgi:hypothetical protein
MHVLQPPVAHSLLQRFTLNGCAQFEDIGIVITSIIWGVFELISQRDSDVVKYDACRHPFRTSSVVRISLILIGSCMAHRHTRAFDPHEKLNLLFVS